jgi:anti-sigma regulatory factor (Ser/Thr protein kinase)
METMTSRSIRVDGPDQVAEARRAAVSLARQIGFDETNSGRAALVVTEAANNIWKHGGGGEILLAPRGAGDDAAIEMLALDKGPGLANPEMAFRDGYSTAGSAGTGLGAMRRLASELDLYTAPEKGLALLARIRKPVRSGHAAAQARLRIGVVSVPMPGESACGDGCAIRRSADETVLLVVDGLGHGPLAAQSADAAVNALAGSERSEPREIIFEIDGALRATRGAAGAVATFDSRSRTIRFAGIGNISALVFDSGQARHMTSLPGILGHEIRNVREFTYEWPDQSLALLYSDGIATHWSIGSYPGLVSRDPALIAGVIYRDWNRGRDDATVVVVCERG